MLHRSLFLSLLVLTPSWSGMVGHSENTGAVFIVVMVRNNPLLGWKTHADILARNRVSPGRASQHSVWH